MAPTSTSLVQCRSATMRSAPVVVAPARPRTQIPMSAQRAPYMGMARWWAHVRPAPAKAIEVWPLKKLAARPGARGLQSTSYVLVSSQWFTRGRERPMERWVARVIRNASDWACQLSSVIW